MEIKKCDEKEAEQQNFGLLASLKNGRDVVVCSYFDIYLLCLFCRGQHADVNT